MTTSKSIAARRKKDRERKREARVARRAKPNGKPTTPKRTAAQLATFKIETLRLAREKKLSSIAIAKETAEAESFRQAVREKKDRDGRTRAFLGGKTTSSGWIKLKEGGRACQMRFGVQESLDVLAMNISNRRVRKAWVDYLARSMSAGDWVMNIDPIALAKDGRLLNGQHRLMAIIESGCPQNFVLMVGVPDEAWNGLDRNASRNIGDILGQPIARIATMNMINQLISTEPGGKSRRILRSQMEELLLVWGDHAVYSWDLLRNRKMIRSGPVRAAFAIAHSNAKHRQKVEDLGKEFVAGFGKSAIVPAMMDVCERYRAGTVNERRSIALKMLRAIQMHVTGDVPKANFKLMESMAGLEFFTRHIKHRPGISGAQMELGEGRKKADPRREYKRRTYRQGMTAGKK